MSVRFSSYAYRLFSSSTAVKGALLWLVTLQLSVYTPLGFAEDIYRWTDAEGKTHYSSSPRNAGDTPADLPHIERENLNNTIKELRAQTPRNCGQHGGVDCSQGADQDGSVICLDGFREAVLPYRFRCLESTLDVDSFHLSAGPEEEVLSLDKSSFTELLEAPAPQYLELIIRNRSAVKAQGIKVYFRFRLRDPDNPRESFIAEGPEEIEPYAISEFRFAVPKHRLKDLTRVGYEVKCKNCRSKLKHR